MAPKVAAKPSHLMNTRRLFLVCSTPLVSDFLVQAIENRAEHLEASVMPTADAIVVLSGGLIVAPEVAAISE